MPKKENFLKHAIILSTYIFLIWGFYRLLFKLPEEIEEFLIKPVLWLTPTFILLKKEKLPLSSVGITLKNLFPAVYLSLGLGAFFVMEAAITNFIKYGGLNFNANIGDKALLYSLAISFATATSEELSFRGYVFTRIWQALGNELWANLITSLIWTLVHLPITVFIWKLNLVASITYLFLTFIFGLGAAFLYARTKNVFSSIFLHVLWEWPIILFR